MKTFLALLAFAFAVNLFFAAVTYFVFPGQVRGAKTFTDYFYYSVGHLTTVGSGELIPETTAVKLWTSIYVLVIWVYIIYIAVNQIHNIKFGRFG
jgi:hypothetical protein